MIHSNKFVNLFIHLLLTLLIVACQAKAVIRHDDTSVTVKKTTEISTVPIIDATMTPQSVTATATLATAVGTPTASLQPTKPIPSSVPVLTVAPTPSPFDGWLVFSSRRQDTNEDGALDEKDGIHIYSLEISTLQLRQLTTGNQRDLRPDWSPDKSQIAFVSNHEGNYDLYVMNSDGSEVNRLTHTFEDESMPRWSPDGTKIVYVVIKTLDSGLQEKRLYLISVSDNNVQQLTNGPDNDDAPDWSPNGHYIAFTREEDFVQASGDIFHGEVVYLMDMHTTQTFRLTLTARESGHGGLEDPQWLPRDGYFLSMTQAPGDLSSVGIKVFELEWKDGLPILYRVFSIADSGGRYTWGSNGDWLISAEPNDSLNDFILLPVNLSTQPRVGVTTDPSIPSSNYYSLNEGQLIMDDTYYDDYPDWAP